MSLCKGEEGGKEGGKRREGGKEEGGRRGGGGREKGYQVWCSLPPLICQHLHT